MKTLFLHPPSFDGFDGGAGSRYQARREIRSFWYPTWLAQPAALVPGSKLDRRAAGAAAPRRRAAARRRLRAGGAAHLDAVLRRRRQGRRGAEGHQSAAQDRPRRRQGRGRAGGRASPPRAPSISSPARNSTSRSRRSPRAAPFADIDGLSYRDGGGAHRPQPARARCSKTWTSCRSSPRSTSATSRSRIISSAICKHPYVSLYTGRGCRSKCTFCLWPQTVGGHRYRVRSVAHVIEEIRLARSYFPQVKEFFFDDDTFTDDRPRAEAIARELGKLGVTWSCNAKANVPRATLEVLRDNGLRLLLVGYETGNQQILNNIKKGMRIDIARRFTKDCHELGITIHGTFILGLPGESQGDDRGDDPLCRRDQPAHDPGVARRALSRHRALPPGGRRGLARHRACRADRRPRRADRAAALPAPVAHRDLRVARNLLQALLFPPAEDRLAGRPRCSAARR